VLVIFIYSLKSGMRDKNVIKNLAFKFLKKYHPECLYAMISGSFVEEHFNETSDVDILLVSKLPDTVIVESYYYHGVEFQTIILPFNSLLEIIEKEINNGEGTYLSILAKGEIILDKRRFLLKLKEYAIAKFENGPIETRPYEIMQLRARLTSKLLDLKGCSSYSDNFFILSDTIQKMLNLHSKHHRTWGNAGKYASRSLEKVDPEFKNELVNSFTHFSKTKDPQPAINFIEKYLEHFGWQLNFFSTREVINEIRNDQLVIFFKSDGWSDLLSEIILPFHEYILSRIDSLEFIIYKSNIENEKWSSPLLIGQNQF
jgi:predicted nucleotidyltransferase